VERADHLAAQLQHAAIVEHRLLHPPAGSPAGLEHVAHQRSTWPCSGCQPTRTRSPPDQAAVGAAGPAVVRTAQRLAAVAATLAEARCPMPADVAERAQLAVLAADDKRGLAADADGEEAAGITQVRCVARQLPRACEDRLLLARGDLEVDVDRRRECGGWAAFEHGHGSPDLISRYVRCNAAAR